MQNTAVVRVGDLDAFVRPAWEAAERIEPTECLHHVEYLAFILAGEHSRSTCRGQIRDRRHRVADQR